ncbi:MAG: nickel pincer cofactor biosynthesis protein LarB [Planctomycetota bacterium]
MNLRNLLAPFVTDPARLEAAVQSLQQARFGQSSEAVSLAPTELPMPVDVDLQRAARCGFPEVVFGEGKTIDVILTVLSAQQQSQQNSLVTRIAPEFVPTITAQHPGAIFNPIARTLRLQQQGNSDDQQPKAGPVYVVTAGSSDRPVAEEAIETLRWMDVHCDLIMDVGVAGPHRLLRHVDRLKTAAAIVCVAGMEAALPSVLGGHVPCPVIGVPTSVGYGASLGGLTAMLSMLTCCASNVVCVNIDAGFKGGYVAGLIATRSHTD